MPSYLAPGVYVEETSFSAPTIEGVGTTTTAFAGPTLTGPVGGMPYGGLPASGSPTAGAPAGGVPQLLTSFGDFQNIYGGYDDLSLTVSSTNVNPAAMVDVNYMAMAVQAFFTNGGAELYVSRVFSPNAGSTAGTIDPGIATSGTASASDVVVAARFPGAFLNGQSVTVALTASRLLNFNNLANLPSGSLLGEPGAGDGAPTLFSNGTGATFLSNATTPAALTAANFPAKLFLLTVQVTAPGANGQEMVYSGLGLDPNHPSYIGDSLGVNPPRPIDQLQNQIWFNIGSSISNAAALFGALFPTWIDPSITPAPWKASSAFTSGQVILDSLGNIQIVTTAGTSGATAPSWNPNSGQTTADGSVTWTNHGPWHPVTIFTLGTGKNGATEGDDGAEPMATDYTTPLQYLQALEDIAIVATPGSSIYADNEDIMIGSLIPHVEAQRAYRVAILEAGPNLLDSDYETVRAQIDSSYAALYVPWVYTPNPLAVAGTSSPAQILVPPSGFMAGIYARSDTQNSVAKAPANEVVLAAVDFERHINFAEQTVLNPLGINCLRFFPDRGFRVWGARTVSSDTELMYINVRRYLIYLEHSIDNGTQWAVFENNGPSLWARVTDSIDSFLNNEFAEGNLLGTSPSDAYFVRCDRTTMTQNDFDNGRLVCLIGVALLKPAEFVIFRIGQMTATARS
ncbi:MAG: phage tail sheath subtilisin-like domain-containing protein [Terracidiphilus sp.]